jgi:hypothetical protein
MKRTIIRIAIASLTFAIGISVTAIYISNRQPVEVSPVNDHTIYDVTYSDLAANPEEYIGKMVRVKALIFGGALDDPRRVNEKVSSIPMGYEFAPDATESSAKLEEAFGPDVYIPHEVVRCERALATVVGEFIEDGNKTKENSKAGNKWSFRYWIIIHRLENTEACPKLWFHDVHAPTPNKLLKPTAR